MMNKEKRAESIASDCNCRLKATSTELGGEINPILTLKVLVMTFDALEHF